MKKRATSYLKQIITQVSSKTKALKTRIIIFSLLHRNNTFFSINHKLQSLLSQHHNTTKYDLVEHDADSDGEDDDSNTKRRKSSTNEADIVHHSSNAMIHDPVRATQIEELEGSVIELVKTSKQQQGQEFRLEDEIDQVADLFIKRFHHQMRLQKQQSFESAGQK